METPSSPVLKRPVEVAKASLPEEIIVTDIISRLPVKRVLQAQCLSKNFSAIATDPHFVSAHLRQSACIRPSIILNRRNHVYLIQCSNGLESEYTVKELTLHHNMQLSTSFDKMMVVASCDGLVVVAHGDNTGECFLWNPSTNQCNRLPAPSSTPKMEYVSVSWGFGCCTESEVYTIIRLVYVFDILHHRPDNCFAEVFTCGIDMAWRRLDFSNFRKPVVFGNGITIRSFVYWDAVCRVLAFDLEKEAFSWVSIPISTCGTTMEFRGSLAVCYWSKIYKNSLELWVMKSKERFASDECSWEKMYTTVSLDSICRVYYNAWWRDDDFPPFTFPARFLNDQLLIISDPMIFNESLHLIEDFTCSLYDFESKEISRVPKALSYDFKVVHNFVESLVPLNSSEYTSNDHDIGHMDEGIDNDEDGI